MLKKQIVDPLFPECPIRNILSRIGDKWAILILLTLEESKKPLRNKEIQSAIPDISQKMLGTVLKRLEADGLVHRKAYSEIPPRVEYSLTARSRSLMPYINGLVGWALDNFSGIIRDRRAYKG